MKTIFAIVLSIFVLGSFSQPAEAGWLRDALDPCHTKKSKSARNSCRDSLARKYDREREQRYRKLARIERSYSSNYEQYKRYELNQQEQLANAANADEVVAELEIKAEVKTLSREEKRDLQRARRDSSRAYKKASSYKLNKDRYARKMAALEKEYRRYGGNAKKLRASLYNVPQY